MPLRTRYGLILLLLMASTLSAQEVKKPNIIWFFVDDMSAHFSCYGEKTIQTPHVDKLAAGGIKFTRAFITCPVCSPCRSALITGCYQTTIGAHHHRSGRGKEKIYLPGKVVPVPKLFQDAGYYTCLGTAQPKAKKGLGKTDYNFEWDRAIYDGNDWSGRAKDQPFFMQIMTAGGKYRGNNLNPQWSEKVKKVLGSVTDPKTVKLPPYYPDDEVLRADWARYLDCCRYTDWEVGTVVARLKEEGLLENTYFFFMTDHGISHARGKQFLYDEGIHVPFIISGPGIPAGKVRTDLVSHIDLTATSLACAGIKIPSWMQGRDLLAKNYTPRTEIYAARDRCDETVDHLRCVRTSDFKYIRNYLDKRPMLQPNNYKDGKVIIQQLRQLHEAQKLNALQERLLFSPTRPKEELYDLKNDPYELVNLATDPKYSQQLLQLRQKLKEWEKTSQDKGVLPESRKMYDSDMAVYLGTKPEAQTKRLRANIALMLEWAAAGK